MSAYGTVNAVTSLTASLDAIRPLLAPPVSNYMLFDDAFKVMAVGGPNQRKDFHIEMGAEIFYQREGPMEVIVINPHTQRSQVVRIEEGEMFYLPPGVPHSPQRFANTLGIVYERVRDNSESDSLRWYNEDDSVLYAEYFYCQSLGTQIKEAIGRFQDFLKAPTPLPPIPESAQGLLDCMEAAKQLELPKPFNLQAALDAAPQGVSKLIDAEFIVRVFKGETTGTIDFPSFVGELYLWQSSGKATITVGTQTFSMSAGDVLLLNRKNFDVSAVHIETTFIDAVLMVNSNNAIF
jgi:3-hydroxyanthranilate 3,4-dioxygenase